MQGYFGQSRGDESSHRPRGMVSYGATWPASRTGTSISWGAPKEIIVLSNGEKVPPEDLEKRLVQRSPNQSGLGYRGGTAIPVGRSGGR